MRVLSKLFVVPFLVSLIGGAAYWWAGRGGGPAIDISAPTKVIGQASPLIVKLSAPRQRLSSVAITIEQNSHSYSVLNSDLSSSGAQGNATVDAVVVQHTVGKRSVPDLQAGPARLIVRATRPALFGLRRLTSEATRDVNVRLDPPRVAEVSTFHYVNQGGAEFVVYRATPADVESGVRVADRAYPGFPAVGAGMPADDSLRVAFFALLFDQPPSSPILLFARDAAGNETAVPLDHRVFPKPFGSSRIEIEDRFLQRVVPAIAATTPDMNLSTAPDQLVNSFLRINNELRRRNNQTIADQAKKTAARMMWRDAFQPLGNAAVEAKFADSRTYFYKGQEIDHQVHLGFDLAVTAHIPVVAANRGVVLYAADLGIYGNCVIVDHGLGVQSLYAHLSSIDVKVGDNVEKVQVLGKSGMTGLAAGDHLHFTMLVNGQPVNSVEWWDSKWVQDRVLRKITQGG